MSAGREGVGRGVRLVCSGACATEEGCTADGVYRYTQMEEDGMRRGHGSSCLGDVHAAHRLADWRAALRTRHGAATEAPSREPRWTCAGVGTDRRDTAATVSGNRWCGCYVGVLSAALVTTCGACASRYDGVGGGTKLHKSATYRVPAAGWTARCGCTTGSEAASERRGGQAPAMHLSSASGIAALALGRERGT